MLRLAANAYGTRRDPFSLVLFLTERCNARCRHCFLDFAQARGAVDELSVEEYARLARHLPASLVSVNLTGGEPFLRDDLPEIVQALCEGAGVRSVIITTNGSRPAAVREFIRRVGASRLRCLLKFSISVDGIGEEHDRSRGVPGLFEKALRSYRTVQEAGDPRFNADIALTVTPGSRNHILETHRALKELGVTQFGVILMRSQGVIREVGERALVAQTYRQLLDAVQHDCGHLAHPRLRHRLLESVRMAKNRIVQREIMGSARGVRSKVRCSAGSLFGVVDARGSVLPCEVLGSAWRLGDLRGVGMDFQEVWRSSRAAAFREHLRRTPCSCTYECAWAVNVAANPRWAAEVLLLAAREVVWNRPR